MAIMSTFFAEVYPHLSAELLPLDMLLSTGPTAALHSEPHPRPRSPARHLRSGSQSLTHLEVWPNLLLSAVLSPPWRSRVYYGCCYQALDSAASHRGQLCSHLPVVRCRRWSRRSSANDSVSLYCSLPPPPPPDPPQPPPPPPDNSCRSTLLLSDALSSTEHSECTTAAAIQCSTLLLATADHSAVTYRSWDAAVDRKRSYANDSVFLVLQPTSSSSWSASSSASSSSFWQLLPLDYAALGCSLSITEDCECTTAAAIQRSTLLLITAGPYRTWNTAVDREGALSTTRSGSRRHWWVVI